MRVSWALLDVLACIAATGADSIAEGAIFANLHGDTRM